MGPALQIKVRHKPAEEVVDYHAKFTSNNEAHGMDLAPALNRMYCRKCGGEVVGTCKCPNCGGEK